jgi:hypothetical protein
MRNPSVLIGFTLISDEEDGHKRISTFDGLMYNGLDDLQVTMIEDIMTNEFAEEFDKLKQKMRIRMVELGYVTAEAAGADVSARPKGNPNKPVR